MPNIKPILFNTDMVRALLDNRKTVTRRDPFQLPEKFSSMQFLKTDYQLERRFKTDPYKYKNERKLVAVFGDGSGVSYMIPTRYCPGDILYVRETWQNGFGGTYLYRADAGHDLFMTPDGELVSGIPWHPSIHMPREAARIFLRVTDVRVERLLSILPCDIQREGCPYTYSGFDEEEAPDWYGWMENVWNSTLKPADRGCYNWAANPWVWVIEFERISKEEAERT